MQWDIAVYIPTLQGAAICCQVLSVVGGDKTAVVS